MRRVVLTALVLAVLLPGAAFARVAYQCGMDGKVRSACCCPSGAKDHRDAAPVTTVKAACCRDISTDAPVKPTAVDPARSETPPPALVATALVPAALPAPRRSIAVSPRSTAPPETPPSTLFASHCALLL